MNAFGKFVLICFVAGIFSIPACKSSKDNQKEMENVVTSREDLEKWVGKQIILRGEVENSKIPTIIGVDVESDDPDLRGQMGEARGILEKWVVKPEEVDTFSANRGAGTFYRIKDPKTGRTVQVQKISKK